LRTIKTARFYGKGLFGYKPEWFMFKKLFGTKTLVLVSKWFSTPTHGLGVEKLRTIKTARFCGRVLFGCPPWGASEKLKSFF